MATKPILKSIIPKKTFNYSSGGINLNFYLRVDNSSEIHIFKRLLEEALKDLDLLLKEIKN